MNIKKINKVEEFTDFNTIPSWAIEAVQELIDQSVIISDKNNEGGYYFKPNDPVSFGEVAKMVVLASGIEIATPRKMLKLDQSNKYYEYIATLYNLKYVDNEDYNFFEKNTTREIFAKIIVNVFELQVDTTGAPHFNDVEASNKFYDCIETVYNNGLMRGYSDGTFGPNDTITRAEIAKIIYDSQLVVSAPSNSAEGTLELSLSSETPRGTNIPYNAVSLPYTTIELRASDDGDIEISSLAVTRLGIGSKDNFDNVWLEIDGFRVGNDKSINSDDIAELQFNPSIVVPAGQTLVADIVASMNAKSGVNSIGFQNRFVVVSANDIASTAENVVGDFPIEGKEMQISSYKATEIIFETLGSNTTVNIGDNFIEIGKFRLESQGTTNKDVEIRAITFKNDGAGMLSENLNNVSLYVSGEQVSAETIIDGDYVTFRLDNGVTGGYVIEDDDTRTFSIRADVISAEDGDVINFKIANIEDFVAVEIGTSFGVNLICGYSSERILDKNTNNIIFGDDCFKKPAENNCARLCVYEIGYVKTIGNTNKEIETIKENQKGTNEAKDFQKIFEEEVDLSKKEERKWEGVSTLAVLLIIWGFVYLFLHYKEDIENYLPLYSFIIFCSAITFVIIKQYAIAKKMRIVSRNRLALSKALFHAEKEKKEILIPIIGNSIFHRLDSKDSPDIQIPIQEILKNIIEKK